MEAPDRIPNSPGADLRPRRCSGGIGHTSGRLKSQQHCHRSGDVPKFALGYDTTDQAPTSIPCGVWVSAEDLPVGLQSIALLSGFTDKQSGRLVGRNHQFGGKLSRIFFGLSALLKRGAFGRRSHRDLEADSSPGTNNHSRTLDKLVGDTADNGRRARKFREHLALSADAPNHSRVEGDQFNLVRRGQIRSKLACLTAPVAYQIRTPSD